MRFLPLIFGLALFLPPASGEAQSPRRYPQRPTGLTRQLDVGTIRGEDYTVELSGVSSRGVPAVGFILRVGDNHLLAHLPLSDARVWLDTIVPLLLSPIRREGGERVRRALGGIVMDFEEDTWIGVIQLIDASGVESFRLVTGTGEAIAAERDLTRAMMRDFVRMFALALDTADRLSVTNSAAPYTPAVHIAERWLRLP